ncbi:hypothetical protein ACJQWK_02680 [Exserohilum turcicum]|uniref:Uncharacterized protein n=1 Tax=Exserohilum turcicum (strain 28A) TaxID=671987 RepID=R0KCN1_EXST2|nr:uncharacterized protein SETTUDRAFT_169527 [Exserohilum turcica Et28A]EOA85967.1 hypothetical protein SETTUDRAFT_169527 [Exserohilum turcica Et28A]
MATHHLIRQINRLKVLAQRSTDNGYYNTAWSAMRKAQKIWTPALGISKPNFSSEGWRKLDIERLNELVALAQRYKNSGLCDAAWIAMRKAQKIWTPELGISKPDSSSEGWREVDMEQIVETTAITEENELIGLENRARVALETAHIAWERLPEPKPPRPQISPKARRQW